MSIIHFYYEKKLMKIKAKGMGGGMKREETAGMRIESELRG